MEIWKDIVGAEQYYQVSSNGNVRNKVTGQIVKPSTSGNYLHVELRYGINKHCSVHRLVAEAFIDNPFGFPCVNHKDENKENNNVENLEWCTYQYNCKYGMGSLARNSRVIQYEMNGNAIKIWDSMKEAAEVVGVKYQSISRCCRGLIKSSGGYMWSFANLEDVRKYYNAKGA